PPPSRTPFEPAISLPQSPRPRRPPRVARSCCSRPRARATTSSRTSRSEARNSGDSWRTLKRAEGHRKPCPDPGHAEPGGVRPGDGLQRHVGEGDAGKLRPRVLPQAAIALRARGRHRNGRRRPHALLDLAATLADARPRIADAARGRARAG